jgi:hypothetical protein
MEQTVYIKKLFVDSQILGYIEVAAIEHYLYEIILCQYTGSFLYRIFDDMQT